MNCSSKLQFCCEVNSALGDLLLWRGGDRVGVVTCFAPPDAAEGGGGSGPSGGPEVGSLGRRFILPSPKLLSAIEFMRFCGCGRMGGELGGMRELRRNEVTVLNMEVLQSHTICTGRIEVNSKCHTWDWQPPRPGGARGAT